ncbi:uncharacterized protein F4807DRAFT_454469 [Annulohypoxylon truncatum]|uniref:uncharacterized protein n=1 Tax=Annulohypoxylon truncatum TaxID=327061 RepID=UPI0020074506|nr:uncharacterized protein F4807DRAFT_454469 [Annulohypoxylon truncatum]KAI1204764.1 hypothetical protein F4807DRAFT_454469 [Annulohypoxylon truncatum]
MSTYWELDAATYARLPHDNRAGQTIMAVVLCMFFATTAVCFRLYTRRYVLKQFWIDDYFAVAGTLSMISNGLVQCFHTRYGLGSHMWDIKDEETLSHFWKLFYFLTLTYATTLMFIKFSLFFQYYRLVQEVPHYRLFYLVVMFLVGGWVIAQEFVLIFSCTPIYSYWDRSGGGRCFDSKLLGWMNAIGNLVTDVVILLLPIPVVWRLNLKKGRKWAVIAIFGLGFFTCVISICRMVFFARLTTDLSYNLVSVAAWGEAESASGLICTSLIALGPLIRRVSRRFRSSKKTSTTPHKYTCGGTNPFSRHTTNRDKSLLRTHIREGSETELNRIDLEQSRKADDDMRSLHSTKSSGLEQSTESDFSETMPDLRLGLQTGIRTVISTGNRGSVHSQSLPAAPNGIVVKQVWSVRERGG